LNPAVNPTLLQRSEVVTLVNTLHQLSESLQAVNEFREMWASMENLTTDSQESTNRLPTQEAQRLPSEKSGYRPQPSSRAEKPPRTGISISSAMAAILKTCRRKTVSCVEISARATQKVFHTAMRFVGGREDPGRPEL